MKKIFFSFLLFSSSVSAQDYVLQRFEANDYRDWTFEEMASELGENRYLLGQYACNGRDEFDPYLEPVKTNPEGNSLKVKNNTTKEIYTYKEGVFTDADGSVVSEFDDLFLQYVSRALKRFESIGPTTKLLRLLERSYFPVTITFGGNSFNPSVPGGVIWSGIKRAQAITFFQSLRMSDVRPSHPFDDIGVGGSILWHPKLKIESIESDGVKRPLDADIALAHEMYHAFDSIRGLLDMRYVYGEKYESESVVEYRAVWFENQVRRELGILYRKHYSDPRSESEKHKDLLDDDGEPILIPSPCL